MNLKYSYQGEPPTVIPSSPELARVLTIIESQLELIKILASSHVWIPAGSKVTEIGK